MKRASWVALGALTAFLVGCTSYPSDRIAAHQVDFNSWPPAVQAAVRAGQVGPGFNEEQVFIALGEPSARKEAGNPGAVMDVWVYHRRAPRLSVGIGGGGFNGNTGVAGGIAANGLKLGTDVDGRVIFLNGRVTDVQVMTR